ncbi:hypothetical protein EV360DRAFT_74554, partial [Lentinula raphanica]
WGREEQARRRKAAKRRAHYGMDKDFGEILWLIRAKKGVTESVHYGGGGKKTLLSRSGNRSRARGSADDDVIPAESRIVSIIFITLPYTYLYHDRIRRRLAGFSPFPFVIRPVLLYIATCFDARLTEYPSSSIEITNGAGTVTGTFPFSSLVSTISELDSDSLAFLTKFLQIQASALSLISHCTYTMLESNAMEVDEPDTGSQPQVLPSDRIEDIVVNGYHLQVALPVESQPDNTILLLRKMDDGVFHTAYTNINSLKCPELLELCKSYSLGSVGNKDMLRQKLIAFSENRMRWQSLLPQAQRAHRGVRSGGITKNKQPAKKSSNSSAPKAKALKPSTVRRNELMGLPLDAPLGTQLFATERSKDMRTLEEKNTLLAWHQEKCFRPRALKDTPQFLCTLRLLKLLKDLQRSPKILKDTLKNLENLGNQKAHKYCLEHPYLSEEEVTRREKDEEEQRAKEEAANPLHVGQAVLAALMQSMLGEMISLNGAFQGFNGGRLPMPQESSARPIPDVSHLPTTQEPTALPISQVSHLPVNPAPQQPSQPLDYGVVASSFRAHPASAPFVPATQATSNDRPVSSVSANETSTAHGDLSNGVDHTSDSHEDDAERIYELTIAHGQVIQYRLSNVREPYKESGSNFNKHPRLRPDLNKL